MELETLAEKFMRVQNRRIKNRHNDKLEDLLKKRDQNPFEDNINGTSTTSTTNSDVSGGGGAADDAGADVPSVTSENSEINNAEKSGIGSDDEYESLPYDIEQCLTSDDDEYDSASGFTDNVQVNLKSKNVRHQRRIRKMLLRVGLKKINDIKCVVIKKTPEVIIIIENPEIYQNPNTDKYVILGGNTKIEAESIENVHKVATGNLNFANCSKKYEKDVIVSELRKKSIQDIWKNIEMHCTDLKFDDKDESDDDDDDDGDNNDDQVGEEEKKETDERNIKLVMEHTNVSHRKAYEALRKHDNDVVNAIMNLIK